MSRNPQNECYVLRPPASWRRRAKAVLERLGLLGVAFRLHEWRQARGASRAIHAPDGLPLPPPELMVLVGGHADSEAFLRVGWGYASAIAETLQRNELVLEQFSDILDFGCGCGRVLRHWKDVRGPHIHGTDVNPRLAAWCAANLPFTTIGVNPPAPPVDRPAGSFDFIYLISIFTHLREAEQHAWLDELARLLRPGGYLLLTTHGAACAADLPAADRARFDADEIVVLYPDAAGSNLCASYHSEAALRRLVAGHFEVLDAVSARVGQDLYLLRKL